MGKRRGLEKDYWADRDPIAGTPGPGLTDNRIKWIGCIDHCVPAVGSASWGLGSKPGEWLKPDEIGGLPFSIHSNLWNRYFNCICFGAWGKWGWAQPLPDPNISRTAGKRKRSCG